MTIVDEEVTRLWILLTELSAQLSANREHCEALKQQCEKLKTQAVNNCTGFALRRFNTDITKEQFDSEIERFNATLILENQTLQYENRQLSILLKDYEGTLDSVMAKFRGFAAATQQYELDSARHYESLLLQYTGTSAISNNTFSSETSHGGALTINGFNAQQQSAPLLVQDPLAVQMSLSHISGLLRKALRSMQGEDPSDDEDEDEEDVSSSSSSSSSDDAEAHDIAVTGQNEAESDSMGVKARFEELARPPRSRSVAKSASSSAPSSGSGPASLKKNLKRLNHDASEGGYLKLVAESIDKAQVALERDIELERLKKENEELRNLLGIAAEYPTDNKTS